MPDRLALTHYLAGLAWQQAGECSSAAAEFRLASRSYDMALGSEYREVEMEMYSNQRANAEQRANSMLCG
jgi:hypothetical protein